MTKGRVSFGLAHLDLELELLKCLTVEITQLVLGVLLVAMRQNLFHRIGHVQLQRQELVASVIGLDLRHRGAR